MEKLKTEDRSINVAVPLKNTRLRSILKKLKISNGYRILKIYPIVTGSVYLMSKTVVGSDGNLSHYGKLKYIIACSIQNNGKAPSSRLLNWLDRNLSTKHILVLTRNAYTQMDAQSIVRCLVLTKGLNILSAQESDAV